MTLERSLRAWVVNMEPFCLLIVAVILFAMLGVLAVMSVGAGGSWFLFPVVIGIALMIWVIVLSLKQIFAGSSRERTFNSRLLWLSLLYASIWPTFWLLWFLRS